MAEDNTPTVTARRRKPTPKMRLRLETAKQLQGLNARSKAKKAAKRSEQDPEKMVLVDPPFSDPKPGGNAPKLKRNVLSKPPRPSAKFRKRQIEKTWLPTHMYHAKRAHLSEPKHPLWRFAIPLTPSEKSYRPTHRAVGQKGAVAWDMSYMNTIGLEGPKKSIEGVLRSVRFCLDEGSESAWGQKGGKWRAGKRTCSGWVFERDGELRPMAPVTVIWCAKGTDNMEEKGGAPKHLSKDAATLDETSPMDLDRPQQRPDKSKPGSKQKERRRAYIRVHPSAFLELWEEILKVSKIQRPSVAVEDLRFEIGSIEIIGPGSTEALLGALKPTSNPSTHKDDPESIWTSLATLSNPAALPNQALLAFNIEDPRLHHPPRTITQQRLTENSRDLIDVLVEWPPDQTQKAPALFSRPARLAASRALPSQKAINRRKSLAAPGTYPDPQPSDPRVPIVLFATRPTSKGNQGSWTLLLPWKCVPAVWYSLMYYPLSTGGNPRFGGLKEKRQVAFEAGEAFFPIDFPGTGAGWMWELAERERKRKDWERRPKAKRVEWDSVDLGDGVRGEVGTGWACDWERLVEGPPRNETQAGDVNAQSNDKAPSDPAMPPLKIRQLSSYGAAALLSTGKATPEVDTSKSLIAVKVTLLNRGIPNQCARIYRLPTTNNDLRSQWVVEANPPTKKNASAMRSNQQPQRKPESAHPRREKNQQSATAVLDPEIPTALSTEPTFLPCPKEEDLIGFVTSGNFSLAEGKGIGIGSLLLSKVLGQQKGRQGRLCIVRNAGESVARPAIWEPI